VALKLTNQNQRQVCFDLTRQLSSSWARHVLVPPMWPQWRIHRLQHIDDHRPQWRSAAAPLAVSAPAFMLPATSGHINMPPEASARPKSASSCPSKISRELR
jgi:hypothetical protein